MRLSLVVLDAILFQAVGELDNTRAVEADVIDPA